MNLRLIDDICDRIIAWNRQDEMTFLIIEHMIISLCDRVWVLAEGQN